LKYRNPVLPGFHPDPSVCRVGSDYYLAVSSFEYFPGVPLFHSRDLVNWRQLGHCLTRPGQLSLARAYSSGGVFAPTIRHHDGRFYMTTTNVPSFGNFYVHTDDPLGEWSDPVRVDQEGIDPSIFVDDNGTAYYTTAGAGILQSTIDLATGKRTSDAHLIWAGTGGRYPEGPRLFKYKDQYYLMIAEGGTEYGHMETIARGPTPWGPFQRSPRNPILTHRNRARHPIQATGHADLVQAHDGSWWAVCLGVRPQNEFYHHLGRETFLAPVEWDPDGWPRVGEAGTVEISGEGPALTPHPWEAEPPRDDFDAAALRPCWTFLRNPPAGSWSLSERPGALRLRGQGAGLDDAKAPAFVGRRQAHFTVRASARLEFGPGSSAHEAGLTAFMNERHHYDLAVTREGGKRTVFLRKRIGDVSVVTARFPAGRGPLTLEIAAEPLSYRFECRAGGKRLRLGTAETRYLSKEVAGGFTGVFLAMYAQGAKAPPADFDWFEYAGKP
jgi:xylan 1,4-beta-xylosidase